MIHHHTLRESQIRNVIREEIALLYEDAKTDKAMREQAISVYKDLLRYLKNGGEFMLDRADRPYLIISDFTDINDDNLLIMFKRKRRATEASYDPSKMSPRIKLFILDEDYYKLWDDELREMIIKRLQDKYTSFIHEYIHYLDDMRIEKAITDLISYRSQQKRVDPDQFNNTYFSDPFEINAHLQSWIAEVQHITEDDDLLRHYMNREWNHDFKTFKSWFFKEYVDDRMKSAMDKDQHRRFVNRLYGYWELLEDEYEDMMNT